MTFDDELTERIIYCIVRVHSVLGPGFVEVIYKRALPIEFAKQNLRVETEKQVPIFYEGHHVGRHALDIVVEGKVIVELKSIEGIGKTQYAQVRSYLSATQLELAILVNFSGPRAGYRRIKLQGS